MKTIVVSNNPLVLDRWGKRFSVHHVDGSAQDVLQAVRDLCHRGHRLLSHPLSGSIKPDETPYKSVLLSEPSYGTDPDSVQLIEKAVEVWNRFGPIRRDWRENELLDFQLVDESLFAGAADSAADDLTYINEQKGR